MERKYLAETKLVGGNEGTEFTFEGSKSGSILSEIKVWVHDEKVKGIKVLLTDGKSKQYGESSWFLYHYSSHTFTFNDGEHFTSLSLWPDKDNKHLCAIKFQTNLSREFYAGMNIEDLKEEKVDVASGVCVGIKGKEKKLLISLGFLFINNIMSAELTDVDYNSRALGKKPKVSEEIIKSISYKNSTSVRQEYTIETSKNIIQKYSWSVNGRLDLSAILNIEAKVPILLKGNHRYEIKTGAEGRYAPETTTEKTESISFPLKVPKNITVNVSIIISEANVNLPFTGLMKITCCNGAVWKFKTSGIYKGAAYSDVKVVVKEK
ncbi:aerolysin-like protein [Tachysurus fulvidraco]|uniref:aerolysin-like protein n=1 Tax=Tachysurus fulvidraco TaxID=1234273 RepID=UPI001FEDCE3C|nr:aerolysin-like protein [Tachysurus fulvidraco]XP_047656455.1 aerolysin-like protein [Tachysurus fulvidraco]XP_047656456.1 aerolysin-like protein [Tachysurus fulvidraco]